MKAIYFLLTLDLFSCSESNVIVDSNNSIQKTEIFQTEQVEKMNSPVMMNGSSFANYFQALYKIGRFDDMILFTSKNVLSKHGRESVINTYKKMDFSYAIKLKSMDKNSDSTYTLNYSGVQFATNKVIRVKVINENDTIKLLEADFIKF